MGSYQDELINVLLLNSDYNYMDQYSYREKSLYELRDFIIEKFGIGYWYCDGCGEFRPFRTHLYGLFCCECEAYLEFDPEVKAIEEQICKVDERIDSKWDLIVQHLEESTLYLDLEQYQNIRNTLIKQIMD